MSTVEIAEVVAEKTELSSVDTLKNLLVVLNDNITNTKSMINTIRGVIKENEKVNKELDKLRNKRSRNKTERSANTQQSGITKPVSISNELAKFLGVAAGTLVPRNEVTKGVSGYVKQNDLSDPTNKQKFVLDDRPAAKTLRALLGNPAEDVTYFNLQRYLKHHYIVTPKDATETVKKAPVPSTPSSSVESHAPTKVVKKVLVKKQKPTELTEEA